MNTPGWLHRVGPSALTQRARTLGLELKCTELQKREKEEQGTGETDKNQVARSQTESYVNNHICHGM